MKKFKLKSVLVVLFLATAVVSCSNDDDKATAPGETTKNTVVTAIAGPATGKVNEELSYDVTFTVDNACGEFSKIVDATIGTEKGLQVEVKYPTGPCSMQIPEPKKTVYKFKSATAGTFAIKFKKSETEFLTQTVVIE